MEVSIAPVGGVMRTLIQLISTLMIFSAPAFAGVTTHLEGDDAKTVYNDLQMSAQKNHGDLFISGFVTEKFSPVIEYTLRFVIDQFFEQDIRLDQTELDNLFRLIEKSGIRSGISAGGTTYVMMHVQVSCTNSGEVYSCQFEQNDIKPSAMNSNTMNVFGMKTANNCHMECAATGNCGGGHYGVCCHEVCN